MYQRAGGWQYAGIPGRCLLAHLVDVVLEILGEVFILGAVLVGQQPSASLF
jgi:hypothetical protein